MDDRPRQVLKQLLAQYGPGLCDQPGRCRGLLLDVLQGACAAEVNTLLLALQYGIVQDLRAAVGTQPPVLLLPQLVQKLRTRVPLDETATGWAIEAWAEALELPILTPPLSSPPLVPSSSPPVASSSPRSPAPLPTWRNSIGMEFALIPAGEFLMGSNDEHDNEKPVHTVRISKPFYLGQYEVTQGQWQVIMGNNPSRFKGAVKLPVESVSWEDVQEFIRRLNTREGSSRYRLPTEAEWEYAARAGTITAYSFGDDPGRLGDYAWFADRAGGKTHPVGQKKPNPWQLYDMQGNVWEWVQDWYGAYAAGAAVDPVGPPSGSSRVNRGGSWRHSARNCRSAYRARGAPDYRYNYLGFRYLGFRLLRMAQ
jgi:formylglycine-generating enzyme required for sulfatase activity